MKIAMTDFRAFASTGMLEIRPLTFLVGENSSGKTSLLAGLSYIWRFQERMLSASFNLPPFDLGTFDEIVHRVRGRTRPDCFKIEIQDVITVDSRRSALYFPRNNIQKTSGLAELSLTFHNNVGDAVISQLDIRYQNYKMIITVDKNVNVAVFNIDNLVIFDSNKGQDELKLGRRIGQTEKLDLSDLTFFLRRMLRERSFGAENEFTEGELALAVSSLALEGLTQSFPKAIFACAPVRSNPSRVYTPTDQIRTPDGTHTPQRLFKIKESNETQWMRIKAGLENFGRLSGMFTAINVARYRSSGSSPFQINVTRKGKQSNIVDVGYGVSQALPILTDLIESPARSGFLFQQPEVHLHPQAQAALGSFFVEYLDTHKGSTIVAETHSDYMIDRVRLAVKEKKIKPSDVSLLYFESIGTGTRVTQIKIDEEGNMLNTPSGFRDFFVREQMNLLGITE